MAEAKCFSLSLFFSSFPASPLFLPSFCSFLFSFTPSTWERTVWNFPLSLDTSDSSLVYRPLVFPRSREVRPAVQHVFFAPFLVLASAVLHPKIKHMTIRPAGLCSCWGCLMEIVTDEDRPREEFANSMILKEAAPWSFKSFFFFNYLNFYKCYVKNL